MEFKLNKIDMELRQQVKDATKNGKVHKKQDIIIENNENQSNNKKRQNDKYSFKKYDKKDKKLTVEVVKTENAEVEAFFMNEQEKYKNFKIGIFLDVRK